MKNQKRSRGKTTGPVANIIDDKQVACELKDVKVDVLNVSYDKN